MAVDERELMLEVRAGGPDAEFAFETLVKQNVQALIGFFYRKSWDADDAHDRAQEVFLKVWNARDSYEPRASFRAYMFQIARNHWIDVVRSRKVRPTMHTGSPSGDEIGRIDLEPAATPGPAEDAATAELRAYLGTAIAGLPDGQREVWELAEDRGLRYAEIGEILGIPVGTVKSRHHHAVRRLRDALEREGIDEHGLGAERPTATPDGQQKSQTGDEGRTKTGGGARGRGRQASGGNA